MALFKSTARARKLTDSILVEPGMSVGVAAVSAITPITANGGQDVADAFMRVYGIGVELCVFGNNNYSITF